MEFGHGMTYTSPPGAPSPSTADVRDGVTHPEDASV
jgi:hypothetical protein